MTYLDFLKTKVEIAPVRDENGNLHRDTIKTFRIFTCMEEL